jgi:hypothetical protein
MWLAVPGLPGAGPDATLEELHYRVDVWFWRDAVRGRVTLKRVGEGKYVAELSGEAQGIVKLLTGNRRDSYQTEMAFRNGKLVPLIYREESRRRGRCHLKEYRFNYAQNRVELWQWEANSQKLSWKWQTDLTDSISDPISAFYNCRLGFMGPIRAGDTIRAPGIPYPEPEEIEVRIGPETQEGRQVMVSLINPAFENERGVVHVSFDKNLVPTLAWSQVGLGKVSGKIQPESRPLKGKLPEGQGTAEEKRGDAEKID